MPFLTLYVKHWCPWCVLAIRRLDEAGYAYTLCDVERDPAAAARMAAISNQRLTPTLTAAHNPGDDPFAVLADFGPEQLEPWLLRHNIPKSHV